VPNEIASDIIVAGYRYKWC